MNEKELIDIIIETLKKKGAVAWAHRYQGGKAAQIKTCSAEYFNIFVKKLLSDAHTVNVESNLLLDAHIVAIEDK